MSNNVKPVLFDSFSYLLILYREGKFTGDQPHHVYHFGTTLEGTRCPEYQHAYRVSQEDIEKIIGWLAAAETEGRLTWRRDLNIMGTEGVERFQFTLTALRRLGADIPAYDRSHKHYDAYWNIPAMREFLGDSVEYANAI